MMTNTAYQWPQRIGAEYDMPVRELVASFARDKYSLRLTAGTLGISRETLTKYAKREGIVFADRIGQRKDCRPRGKGWPLGKARKLTCGATAEAGG